MATTALIELERDGYHARVHGSGAERRLSLVNPHSPVSFSLEDAMSLFYKFAYWGGFKPWEHMTLLPIADQISSLFDREERERQPPYGPVLDLGCGSGIWSVKLAARGWEVTGVDIVPKALRIARKRAREASVEVGSSRAT